MYNKSIKKMIEQQNKLKKLYEKSKWITQHEDMINQISGVTSFINQQQDAFNQTKKLAGLLNTNAFDLGLKIEPIPGVTSFINQQQDAFNIVNRTNKIAGLLNTNAFDLGLKFEAMPGVTSFINQQQDAFNIVNRSNKIAGLLNTNTFDLGLKLKQFMEGPGSILESMNTSLAWQESFKASSDLRKSIEGLAGISRSMKNINPDVGLDNIFQIENTFKVMESNLEILEDDFLESEVRDDLKVSLEVERNHIQEKSLDEVNLILLFFTIYLMMVIVQCNSGEKINMVTYEFVKVIAINYASSKFYDLNKKE